MSIRKSGASSVRAGQQIYVGRHWLTAFYALVPLIFISNNICYANVYSKQFFKFIVLRSHLQFTSCVFCCFFAAIYRAVVARKLLFQFLIHLPSNGFLLRSVLEKGPQCFLYYNYFLLVTYWWADGHSNMVGGMFLRPSFQFKCAIIRNLYEQVRILFRRSKLKTANMDS